jgi:hypothetical protein
MDGAWQGATSSISISMQTKYGVGSRFVKDHP